MPRRRLRLRGEDLSACPDMLGLSRFAMSGCFAHLPAVLLAARAGAGPLRALAVQSRLGNMAMRSTSAPVGARPSAEDLFAQDERPIILFDGVCNLCSGAVNLVLDWDKPRDIRGRLRFAALQSDVGRMLLQREGRSPDDISSIVLVTKDRAFFKSDAVLRIGQQMGSGTALAPLFPVTSTAGLLLVPPIVRDSVYDLVANNRYNLLGKRTQCRVSDARFDERFVGALLSDWQEKQSAGEVTS